MRTGPLRKVPLDGEDPTRGDLGDRRPAAADPVARAVLDLVGCA